MAAHGVRLLDNKNDLAEEDWKPFNGGRTVLSVVATSFPTTLQLQFLGPDGLTAVSLGANIVANGFTSFDLPAGSYRMILTGGTATAVYATISTVPYC